MSIESVPFRETPRRVYMNATFFYADDCVRCEPTLLKVLPLFAEHDLQVVVRKPTREEQATPGFGFPALFLPIGYFGLKQGHLLVGEGLVEAFQRVLDTKQPCAEDN